MTRAEAAIGQGACFRQSKLIGLAASRAGVSATTREVGLDFGMHHGPVRREHGAMRLPELGQ